jgi:hypothetical protein
MMAWGIETCTSDQQDIVIQNTWVHFVGLNICDLTIDSARYEQQYTKKVCSDVQDTASIFRVIESFCRSHLSISTSSTVCPQKRRSWNWTPIGSEQALFTLPPSVALICQNSFKPSYITDTFSPSLYVSIHLNQIQSPWRWRQYVAWKYHNRPLLYGVKTPPPEMIVSWLNCEHDLAQCVFGCKLCVLLM